MTRRMAVPLNSDPRFGFATRAIHSGYDAQAHGGALAPPIYQTATFAFASAEQGAARRVDPGSTRHRERVGHHPGAEQVSATLDSRPRR